MIVARICEESGKPLAASGSIKIANYDGAGDGWFPIESFNFGLQEKPDKNDHDAHGAAHPASGGPSASAHSPAPGVGKGGNEDHTLSLEKAIDTATCSLMTLVMKERGN